MITAEAASTVNAAGSSRRARLAQNWRNEMEPVRVTSLNRCAVIRYPEITKNTSTPSPEAADESPRDPRS